MMRDDILEIQFKIITLLILHRLADYIFTMHKILGSPLEPGGVCATCGGSLVDHLKCQAATLHI